MKNKLIILFLFTILPFIFIKPVFAGFGVSPAEIYNDSLKPGAKFEKEIVLSRSDANENLKVIIETDLGEAESWIKFEPGKEFIFAKGENRKTIKAIVTIPNNAELKNYKGLLRIKASSADSSNSGVSIVQGARMEVNLVTTSINVNILNIKGLSIANVDFGQPIKLLVNIENNGNTEVAPSKIVLEIQDLTQTIIDTQEVSKLEKVDPNTTKEIIAEFKNKLNGGEYFGIIKVYLDDKLLRSDRLVFKVNPSDEVLGKNGPNESSLISRFINLIKENKTETAAVILITLFPIIIGLIIFKKAKLLGLKTIFIIATIIYTIVSFTFIYFYHQRQNDLSKPGDKGNVQGETIEITPTSIPKNNSQTNLVVDKTTATYPIYRIPNLESEIIYTAAENEKLSVLEEIDGWYRVSTGQGAGGWLPKSSVKQTK